MNKTNLSGETDDEYSVTVIATGEVQLDAESPEAAVELATTEWANELMEVVVRKSSAEEPVRVETNYGETE